MDANTARIHIFVEHRMTGTRQYGTQGSRNHPTPQLTNMLSFDLFGESISMMHCSGQYAQHCDAFKRKGVTDHRKKSGPARDTLNCP